MFTSTYITAIPPYDHQITLITCEDRKEVECTPEEGIAFNTSRIDDSHINESDANDTGVQKTSVENYAEMEFD